MRKILAALAALALVASPASAGVTQLNGVQYGSASGGVPSSATLIPLYFDQNGANYSPMVELSVGGTVRGTGGSCTGLTVTPSGTTGVNLSQVLGSALSVTNPLFSEITDGANGAAAVKPGTTAPVAGDKALVVALSPNGPITFPGTAVPSTYGTAPSGTVPAVNAFITNGSAYNPFGAVNTTAPTSASNDGGTASTAEPSKVTTGYLSAFWTDLVGKLVVSPYAAREVMWRGTVSGTTAQQLLATQSAGVKTYITDIECGRIDGGTTAINLTFSDDHSTVLPLPNNGGGGGNNKTFNVPLVTAAATALTVTPSSAVQFTCSAQGFTGY